jgi:hypothetical protein
LRFGPIDLFCVDRIPDADLAGPRACAAAWSPRAALPIGQLGDRIWHVAKPHRAARHTVWHRPSWSPTPITWRLRFDCAVPWA